MYFEIYKRGKLIKRGKEILNDISFSNELMVVPSMSLKLPITYREYLSGQEEMKVFVNGKCFWGIVLRITENKADETIDVSLEHVVHEWTYRQISVNNAIKDKTVNILYKEATEEDPDAGEPSVDDQLEDIYNDTNFAYPGWRLNMSNKAKSTHIDYVYSRQNKLEALEKTMELTPDMFWRVRFVDEKVIDIGEFGEKKEWIISLKHSGPNNVRILSEPTVEHDFSNVINLATVYSEKSDSGMSSMTLREVYMDESLQENGFPCLILRSGVNNERDYRMYSQYPKLAPNNELEYAVMDEESVALEGGVIIEGTFAFNDLSPFNVEPDASGNTPEVTDEDRIDAAKTAYHAAIRKLKHSRRSYSITVTTEELPADIAPGDKVRFIYDNSLYILGACSNYMKKILSMDDWFYVTSIDYDIEDNGLETDKITLEKYIRIDREGIEE